MKTRVNIFCILIFMAIGASLIHSLKNSWQDMAWAFQQGWEDADQSTEYNFTSSNVFLSLRPDVIGHYSDSVYNQATGKWLPLQYRDIVVQTEKQANPAWKSVVVTLLAFAILILWIIQLVTFVKLIRAINRSVVFAWPNVMKLKVIGYSMVAAFVSNALFTSLNKAASLVEIRIEEYTLYNSTLWEFGWLIPGLSVLLIAEIFAIGLRMKEEQDLTI